MSRHFSRLRQLRTPAPTEDLRVTMAVTIHHLLADGSYLCKWQLKSSVKPTMGFYLNTVKRGGAIIAPDTIQHPLNVTQLVSAPPAVHVGDGLPNIPPGTELFPGLKTHCPIIASNTVEMISQWGHSTRWSPTRGGKIRVSSLCLCIVSHCLPKYLLSNSLGVYIKLECERQERMFRINFGH